ncbi:MAG: ABC transporter permease [Saprospiraceae bacterium]|nr:ABC transporter permease [Saprospiraceae bacterium]
MIQNFLLILRSMRRQKGFLALNFIGLYLGLAVALLIGVMIFHERSFDNFHREADNLYRVVCDYKSPNHEVESFPLVPAPLTEALRADFPEIASVTRVRFHRTYVVKLSAERFFEEKNVVFADSAFFHIFNFAIKTGNGNAALARPGTVLLTESAAARYFPGESPLGKQFGLEDGDKTHSLEVVGIMADPPANSHLPFSMLVSAPTLPKPGPEESTNWGWFNGGNFAYVRLHPNAQPTTTASNLSKYANDKKDKGDDAVYTYKLQPMAAIHADQQYADSGAMYTADFQQFYWLGAIGLFLLLVACINYVNLSTAIAVRKSREIGVRKTLGASRWELARQFLSETFLLSLGAVVLASTTVQVLLPVLNEFLDRQITAQWWSLQTVGLLAGLCVAITVLAGLYPAVVMAGFNPITALRSRFGVGHSRTSLNLRKSLVTFQFVVAQVFIVAVVVASLQMKYLRTKPLGFRHEGIVEMHLPENSPEKETLLRARLAEIPGIREMSFSMGAPISKRAGFTTRFNLREKYEQNKMDISVKLIDANYQNTYGIDLVAGRFINEADEKQCTADVPEDKRTYVCVVNESAVKALGFPTPEAALGHEITLGINHISPPIVGVVRDFHTSSLHEKMIPAALVPFSEMKDQLSLQLEPAASNAATLAAIGDIWKTVFPGAIFDSSFLAEDIAALYRTESRLFTLIQLIALLALFINALGLIGLTAFVVEQKTKEIGVRKVLGASVRSITQLLTRDYLKLVVAAFVIASPLAWYSMNYWLSDFAYRIEMRWWMFAVAGLIALAIAFLTVSFQSVKAAVANPVTSLRSE